MNDQQRLASLLRIVTAVRQLNEQLPPQSWQMLLVIAFKPGINAHHLADATGLAQSSVSRNLALLSERARGGKPGLELVEAIPDPEDPRRKLAFLTRKGVLAIRNQLTAHGAESSEFTSISAAEYISQAKVEAQRRRWSAA